MRTTFVLLLVGGLVWALVWAAARGPATETTLRFGSGWCADGCLTLAEWPGLVSDRKFLVALSLAYDHAPQWRPLAQAAVRRRTRVTTGPDSPDYGGYYQPLTNTIVITDSSYDEPVPVLAAMLAHEVVHAATVDAVGRPGPANCVESEMLAFAWEAHVWTQVPHGRATAPFLDDLVQSLLAHRLRDHVLLDSLYQRRCLGRELPSY